MTVEDLIKVLTKLPKETKVTCSSGSAPVMDVVQITVDDDTVHLLGSDRK